MRLEIRTHVILIYVHDYSSFPHRFMAIWNVTKWSKKDEWRFVYNIIPSLYTFLLICGILFIHSFYTKCYSFIILVLKILFVDVFVRESLKSLQIFLSPSNVKINIFYILFVILKVKKELSDTIRVKMVNYKSWSMRIRRVSGSNSVIIHPERCTRVLMSFRHKYFFLTYFSLSAVNLTAYLLQKDKKAMLKYR